MHNHPERTAAAVYYPCGRASRVRRRGRSTALRYPLPVMGYDLHITRRDDWTDQSGPVITEAEWRDLIAADPELSLDTQTRLAMSDGDYVFAAWNGRAGALAYHAGEITASNPDRPLIAKMVQVAQKLR